MKIKGMGIALLSTAALLGSAVAQAELPWTYGEFGYSKADSSDFSESDAYDLKASIGFASKWHASLQWTDGESKSEEFNFSEDFDGYSLVVGAHPQLTPNTQLIADLGYFDYEYDGGEGSDGFRIGFGLRHALTDKLEIMSEIWYNDGSYDDTFSGDVDYQDTNIEVGGRYNWMPQLSTGLTLSIGGQSGGGFSSDDVARFDVRWSFLGDVSK
jgi:hypothetical protein